MRILTYLEDGRDRVGLVGPNGLVDMSTEFATVIELIEALATHPDRRAALQAWATSRPARPLDGSAPLTYRAPIPVPRRNVFCVGWNYAKHHQEGARAWTEELPDWPTFFTKPTTAVIGPDQAIEHDPNLSEQLDYEAELAVVIGRGGRGISEEAALDHVFGYMLANDVSARDIQRRHGGQWFKGKALDTSCPTGPWIVTADEIPDPQALRVICRLNGVLMQDGATSDMIFTIARLIAELSRGMTLLPGDILLTGTPDGVGAHRAPPRFLLPGDRVRIECSAIGVLENEVVGSDLLAPRAGQDRAELLPGGGAASRR